MRGWKVWCWDDLWRAVREERGEGPSRLSTAAARAVLGEAIARARVDGALTEVAGVIDWPGFRRRLVARIAAWTRAERRPDGAPAGDDPTLRAQWAIFGRYRDLLVRLGAEDDDGFAAWASRTLLHDPPGAWKRPGQVVFLDPELHSRAAWRAVEFAEARARSVELTLAFDPEPALAEVYGEAAAIRKRLLARGFGETAVGPELWRPKGLRDVEHELFRADGHQRSRLTDPAGLFVLGAPEGEGTALVLARLVRRLLDHGTVPEEILILFRQWNEAADLVLETLRLWGLPAGAAKRRPLASFPSIAALRLAMSLPVDGWEAEPLIQLLRNGQVRPAWAAGFGPHALPAAASAIRSTRVFRGLPSLLAALDRGLTTTGRKASIQQARSVVNRLAESIGPLDQQRTWDEHAEQLRGLADELALGGPDEVALDHLWNALDDHGAVLAGLDRAGRRWSWTDFSREVASLAGEVLAPAAEVPPGSIRLAAVDDVAGARAERVILAGLGEGSFPTREAIDGRLVPVAADPTENDVEKEGEAGPGTQGGPSSLAFGREMLRFLRVVGAADSGLVLAYPTTDAQGQELLRAGFLDDLLGLFTREAAASPEFHESHRRFDPALAEWPDLAGSPADARVHAVARACLDRDFRSLAALAREARHRSVLDGVAAALRVADSRLQSRRFGVHDGHLEDPRAVAAILTRFGPDYTFSPSQLESFLFCPFQFFLRYVLKLEPVDERDELEEDYTERGSRVHRVLEQLERMLAQEPGERLERAEAVILGEMESIRDRGSEIDSGLDEIERRRLVRTVRRYVRQYEAYQAASGEARPVPHLFEVVFGLEEDDPQSYPGLTLGDGHATVRLQGKIDRIDLVSGAERSAFRVIDYKTGSCPSKKDVKEAIYLQLPLYALAVERVVLRPQEAVLHDVGYWGLASSGFKPIPLKNWECDRQALEEYVTAVVAQLRQGVFVVDSCKDDCTARCEYSSVCRVQQVRAAGKARENPPGLELGI